MVQPGRNDPCPCGSGKKYKKCCGAAGGPVASRALGGNLEDMIAAFEAGRYAAAVQAAQALTRTRANDPTVWQILGIAAYYLGDVATAAGAFNQLVKLDPRSAEAWNNLALMQYEQGELVVAGEAAEQAIKLQPQLAAAHNNLGNVQRAQREYASAATSYHKAISLGLPGPEVYCNLGSVLQEQGDYAGARQAYDKALQLAPEFAAAHSNLGGLLLIEGALSQAHEHLGRANELMPDDVDVLGNLGEYWQESGDIEKARNYHQRALAMRPDSAETHFRLGQFLHDIGENRRGREYLLKAIQLEPKHVMSLATLGKIAFAQGQMADAEMYYRQAMTYGAEDLVVVINYCEYLLNRQCYSEAQSIWEGLQHRYPDNMLVKAGLAEYYNLTMQHDRAAEIYSQLVKNQPGNANHLVRWSIMEEKRHHVAEAIALARQGVNIERELLLARLALVRALVRDRQYDEALAEIASIDVDKLKLDPMMHYNMLFERATLEDRLGQYDIAYTDLIEANTLKARVRDTGYDSEKVQKEYTALCNIFNKENYSQLPKFSGRDKKEMQPIFIVGFPRSGTTLLEQILVSHSKVSGGDELIFISDISRQIKSDADNKKNYPEILLDETNTITPELLGEWHDYYLERVNEQGIIEAGSSMFTDKMPHNLEKLGLIHLLFPQAPIIHITRHPMDACLSAFMANFARGHYYTASMETTATHYSQMMELAEHYKTELDINYLQIRYEDILDDPQGKVREVLEFVGLPWEDACLNFHESKRISKTASYAQVTQKLYTTSRYRYKNYYKHLEPLEPILREAMQRFGYTFEPPEEG